MKETVEHFSIDIIDKGNDNCDNIKGKVLKLVGNPDRQQVNLFDGGLASYLKRT